MTDDLTPHRISLGFAKVVFVGDRGVGKRSLSRWLGCGAIATVLPPLDPNASPSETAKWETLRRRSLAEGHPINCWQPHVSLLSTSMAPSQSRHYECERLADFAGAAEFAAAEDSSLEFIVPSCSRRRWHTSATGMERQRDGERFIDLGFWDPTGCDLRLPIPPPFYRGAVCAVVCFAVNDRASFEALASRWLPELITTAESPMLATRGIVHWDPNSGQVTFPGAVLCGTKYDLSGDGGGDGRAVSIAEAEALASSNGMSCYFETSAVLPEKPFSNSDGPKASRSQVLNRLALCSVASLVQTDSAGSANSRVVSGRWCILQ